VGGGFTGLWTAVALQQADPSCSVAVLEGAAIGSGASGRCGGFAMTLVDRSLTDLVRRVGRSEALAIHSALAERVSTLAPFLAAHGIDCDAMPNGLLVVSSGPEQDERIETELATMAKLGIEARFLDRAAVQREIHSETLRSGFEDPACTLVDPAKLARGLARFAESLGVRIFERTPVLEIEETSGRVRLRTAAGTVVADRVVLGLNSFGFALPELRRYLMTFYSYIVLTEPLGDERWERIGWKRRQGVEDRRTFLHYPRPTADGRIVWGGWKTPLKPNGPDIAHDRDPQVFENLERTFRTTFPQLADVGFTHRWGGPLAITGRFMPAVGWLSPGRIAFGFGYNGHGVGPSRLVGEIVRDLLLDRRTGITELAFVRKKPTRLPGGALRDFFVATAIDTLLRADDAGKPEPLPFRLINRVLG